MGGEEPPHDSVGCGGGRLSPRDGASTELVTLEVRLPKGLSQRKGKRKTKDRTQEREAGRSRHQAEQAKSRQRLSLETRAPPALGATDRGALHREHAPATAVPCGAVVTGAQRERSRSPPGHDAPLGVDHSHACGRVTQKPPHRPNIHAGKLGLKRGTAPPLGRNKVFACCVRFPFHSRTASQAGLTGDTTYLQ